MGDDLERLRDAQRTHLRLFADFARAADRALRHLDLKTGPVVLSLQSIRDRSRRALKEAA